MVEAAETLRLAFSAGRRDQLGDDQLEHAVVEQAHQAEPLGERHDLAGRASALPSARRIRIRHS